MVGFDAYRLGQTWRGSSGQISEEQHSIELSGRIRKGPAQHSADLSGEGLDGCGRNSIGLSGVISADLEGRSWERSD